MIWRITILLSVWICFPHFISCALDVMENLNVKILNVKLLGLITSTGAPASVFSKPLPWFMSISFPPEFLWLQRVLNGSDDNISTSARS